MDDDGDDKDDSKRRTRNLSEKKRRDQFNTLVNELGSMISSNSRRMDKSSILKSTISFLRNHNEVTARSRVHDIQEDWKPTFLSKEEFTYLMLEALEGFLMVCSSNGHIFYVSEGIAALLGHNPKDIVNTSLFDLTFQEDRHNVFNILQNGTASKDPNQLSPENEIRFQCHLQRGKVEYQDKTTYELIDFSGHFRLNVEQTENDETSGFQPEHDTRLLYVCTGKLHTPQLIRDVSLVDSNHSEFTSWHSLEWKFLGLDHRAPPIIGYLPFEVLGTSGYDYYHFDDLEQVITCHESLMLKGEITSDHYRFLTKGQQWIWLQTRHYITYQQWNAKPEFIVSTHKVVNCADITKAPKEDEDVHQVESEGNEEQIKANSSDNVTIYDGTDTYSDSYHSLSQCTSGSTSGTVTPSGSAAWSRQTSQFCYNTTLDKASVSSDSQSSQRNESCGPMHKVIPQHCMGTQYLQPPPYLDAIGVFGVMAQPPLPIIVSSDQAQMQEHLQRKHEELQQMIVRQQEELRQVKEQLLLVRLGLLPPIVDVPHTYTSQQGSQPSHLPVAPIIYEETPRMNMGYTQQQPPRDGHEQPPHQNPHLPR